MHVQKSASSTLGLHWKEVDKPEQGTEISNEKLCEALQSNRLNFTRQELNACGVKASDLTANSYIKVHDKHFAPGRAPLGSQATLEEFQAENRHLTDDIATLEKKLLTSRIMNKHWQASYDAAVETLTRTITSHETVAVCLLMEKYEAETTQSKEELMAIEQVQTTLSESVCARAHQPFFFSSLYARLLLLSVPL